MAGKTAIFFCPMADFLPQFQVSIAQNFFAGKP
jgi:hypothetical protein